jgi:hypothetical protein
MLESERVAEFMVDNSLINTSVIKHEIDKIIWSLIKAGFSVYSSWSSYTNRE